MADEYSRRLAQVVVAQIAEITGFTHVQESAVDILAELLVKYITELCTAAHERAELAHRADFNIIDLSRALESMGCTFEELNSCLEEWIEDQEKLREESGAPDPIPGEGPLRFLCNYNTGGGAAQSSQDGAAGSEERDKEQKGSENGKPAAPSGGGKQVIRPPPLPLYVQDGFAHPLPDEYPVRGAGRFLPSFEEKDEEAPPHIPAWMPAFPDRHMLIRTPAFSVAGADAAKPDEVISRRRRQGVALALSLNQRLAKTRAAECAVDVDAALAARQEEVAATGRSRDGGDAEAPSKKQRREASADVEARFVASSSIYADLMSDSLPPVDGGSGSQSVGVGIGGNASKAEILRDVGAGTLSGHVISVSRDVEPKPPAAKEDSGRVKTEEGQEHEAGGLTKPASDAQYLAAAVAATGAAAADLVTLQPAATTSLGPLLRKKGPAVEEEGGGEAMMEIDMGERDSEGTIGWQAVEPAAPPESLGASAIILSLGNSNEIGSQLFRRGAAFAPNRLSGSALPPGMDRYKPTVEAAAREAAAAFGKRRNRGGTADLDERAVIRRQAETLLAAFGEPQGDEDD